MMIFTKSERAAQRVRESITSFIEKKLFLKVNQEKTKVGRLSMDIKFLGFGFYFNAQENKWKVSVHKKSRAKFMDKMKAILGRRCPRGIEWTRDKFNTILRGWVNYFKLGISKTTMETEDAWMRRRIRQIYLKAWKRKYTMYKNLLLLTNGKKELRCREVAFSSEGWWAKARTANNALANKILREKLGWYTIRSLWEERKLVESHV